MDRTPKLQGLSDEELLARYRNSHGMEYATALFVRYTDLIYGVCLKYLRDRDQGKDAVMDIYERMVEALRMHEVRHFKSWLFVTTKNHCLMKLRQEKTHPEVELKEFVMENADWAHLDGAEERETNLVKLEECIGKLEGKQKRCVEMFYLHKKSYREICAVTGFDFKAVKSYVQNGKRNLKTCLEKNGQP